MKTVSYFIVRNELGKNIYDKGDDAQIGCKVNVFFPHRQPYSENPLTEILISRFFGW